MGLKARFQMYDIVRPTKECLDYYTESMGLGKIAETGAEIEDLITYEVPDDVNPLYAHQEFKLKGFHFWTKSEGYMNGNYICMWELVKKAPIHISSVFD